LISFILVKERGIPQSNKKTETGKQIPQEKLSEKTPSLSGEKVTQKSLPNTKQEEVN
jgi:hypothetical protein